jgi:GntR family transcriptional repressor for pyruvate dehydrogenase complex
MDHEPRNANIADTIFADLRRQILGGELVAGQRLAGERELAAKYGTNRNTLREAVRKLEQARLVTVRHGQGVTVADFRKTGTLELLSPFLLSAQDPQEVAHVIADILEPRVLLLEYATRLAVRRADNADVERLRDISELLISAFEQGDPAVVARGFQRWLDTLIDAGHSVTVRWFANPMLDAYRDLLDRFPALWVLEPSFPNHLREFISALNAGDEERAVLVTRDYYERVDSALARILRQGNVPARENRAAPKPSASTPQEKDETVVPIRRSKGGP